MVTSQAAADGRDRRCPDGGAALPDARRALARSGAHHDTLADIIVTLYKSGLTILMIEQRVDLALRLADRGYVMETGRIVLEDNADALLADERVREAYLSA